MGLMTRACKSERMNIERLLARAFVVAGGLFWYLAAMGAATRYLEDGSEVFAEGWILLGVTVVLFVIGWLYEKLAAVVLVLLSVGFVVYGLLSPGVGEAGVWAIWLLFTVAPALIAATLFLLASRMQRICELEESAAS